jgi:GNAT superfamily N-acetyltransferase
VRLATLRLYEQHLAGPSPASSVVLPPPLDVCAVASPAALGDVGAHWHPEAEVRLRAGQVCAVGRAPGEVVGYCWLTTSPAWVEEIARFVVPGPGEAYLYDAYTAPAWRGRGLFPAALAVLLAHGRARGLRRALIFVLDGNRASVRAIERAGFQAFQVVTRLEVCGVERLCYRGPRAGRHRVTLVERW